MPLDIVQFSNQIQMLRNNKRLSYSNVLDQLIQLYNQLLNFEKAENNQAHIEKLKTQLIAIFYLKLDKVNEINIFPRIAPPRYKQIFSYCISLVGTFLAGVSGYTAARSLISAFTNFADPLSFASGIIIGILEAAIFVGVDVLDINKTGKLSRKFKPYMVEYEKQLEKTKLVQEALLSNRAFRKLSTKDFLAAKSFISILQKDIRQKNEEIAIICKDTLLKKTIKTVGACLCAASGIIAGKSLICFFGAAALASGPIGWVAGALVGLLSLTTFIYARKNSVMEMCDKFIGFPKALKKSQDAFIISNQQYRRRLDEIIADKENDESKVKAMNDRLILLESEIDELKFMVNARPKIKQVCRDESSIPSVKSKNQKLNLAKMFFGRSLRIKDESIFPIIKKGNNSTFMNKLLQGRGIHLQK